MDVGTPSYLFLAFFAFFGAALAFLAFFAITLLQHRRGECVRLGP